MSKFLINLDDGSIAFRNGYTDKQVNMKPISDDIAMMIRDGKVASMDVVKAINAKIRENGEFDDIEKYMKERANLNVRRSNPQKPVANEKLTDRSKEEVSVADVYAAIDEDEKKPRGRKAKADSAAEPVKETLI